jgi:plasmid maintenance system antidote protein VapI
MKASELARVMGRSEATISRLLSGARRPGLDTMLELRTHLGWRIGEQADAIQSGRFGAELAERMERQPTQ